MAIKLTKGRIRMLDNESEIVEYFDRNGSRYYRILKGETSRYVKASKTRLQRVSKATWQNNFRKEGCLELKVLSDYKPEFFRKQFGEDTRETPGIVVMSNGASVALLDPKGKDSQELPVFICLRELESAKEFSENEKVYRLKSETSVSLFLKERLDKVIDLVALDSIEDLLPSLKLAKDTSVSSPRPLVIDWQDYWIILAPSEAFEEE